MSVKSGLAKRYRTRPGIISNSPDYFSFKNRRRQPLIRGRDTLEGVSLDQLIEEDEVSKEEDESDLDSDSNLAEGSSKSNENRGCKCIGPRVMPEKWIPAPAVPEKQVSDDLEDDDSDDDFYEG